MIFERLPYQSRAGFDCRRDHANCPACKAHGEGDHGISGGLAWFALKTQHPEDGRVAVLVLEILLSNYPPTTSRPLPPGLLRPRGALVALHIEVAEGERGFDCEWVGGFCDGGPQRGRCSATLADRIYREHGSQSGEAEQSEAFWGALEYTLTKWLEEIPGSFN